MKSKLKLIIIIAVIILILVGIAILNKIMDNRHIIGDNDPYAVGSTPGNIYNNGLYAEENGIVFFANPYDGGKLYTMNADQSDIKRIASGDVSFINVINGYAYYFSSTSGDQSGLGYVRNGRGLYRTDLEGSTFAMTKCTTDGLIVVGNYLYFLYFEEGSNNNAHVSLHKVSINDENLEMVLDEHICLGGYSAGKLYYGGVNEDHHLYSLNLETGQSEQVSNINVYLPIVNGDYVYYLDLNNDYHLTSMYLPDGSTSDLSGERVDTYNMNNSVIYYQNCDPNAYALKRMNIDGSNKETVQTGIFKNINITSTYTYFQDFKAELSVYYTPTNGSISVQPFDNARQAAIAAR